MTRSTQHVQPFAIRQQARVPSLNFEPDCIAFVSGGAQDTFVKKFLLTKTGTTVAVPAIVTPTALSKEGF